MKIPHFTHIIFNASISIQKIKIPIIFPIILQLFLLLGEGEQGAIPSNYGRSFPKGKLFKTWKFHSFTNFIFFFSVSIFTLTLYFGMTQSMRERAYDYLETSKLHNVYIYRLEIKYITGSIHTPPHANYSNLYLSSVLIAFLEESSLGVRDNRLVLSDILLIT